MNLQRHLLGRGRQDAGDIGLRESDHEHITTRQLVRLVAAVAAHREQRRFGQSRRIRVAVHAARQVAQPVPLFGFGDESNLMRNPERFLIGGVLGVGINNSAH